MWIRGSDLLLLIRSLENEMWSCTEKIVSRKESIRFHHPKSRRRGDAYHDLMICCTYEIFYSHSSRIRLTVQSLYTENELMDSNIFKSNFILHFSESKSKHLLALILGVSTYTYLQIYWLEELCWCSVF